MIQWKLPQTLSHWIQRAGRVVRDQEMEGTAILIVERGAYRIDLFSSEIQASRRTTVKGSTKGSSRGGKTGSLGAEGEPEGRAAGSTKTRSYAVDHGINRGGSDKADSVPVGKQPPLDRQALDEGLLVYVQSTTCRRAVQADAYANMLKKDCKLLRYDRHR